MTTAKILRKRYLIYCLALTAVIYLISAASAYQKFHEALVNTQLANQQKMTRIINQSLKLYFDKLKFVTENAVLERSFGVERTETEDALRYQPFHSKSPASDLQKLGITKILADPRSAVDAKKAKPGLRNWQAFKALPELDSKGALIASDRRIIARNILKTFGDIHYVFEMDMNGDLVFLEPFDIQKNITSFNYEYRDYLRMVKSSRASAVSEGYISHDALRTQVITVASPIYDSTNKIVKVFAASVSAAVLREKVFQALKESMDIQDGTAFYLVDRHAHIVASSSGQNTYFPIEGGKDDEKDQGNLRNIGFFRDVEWIGDTLEKGNVWERGTRSWQFSALKRDYSGEYKNLNGVTVFGTFYPTAIIAGNPINWGILIETPIDQILIAKHALGSVFTTAGAVLTALLLLLASLIFRNLNALEDQVQSKERELTRIAAQVAHDIRSPLASLEVVSQSCGKLPEKERVMARGAISRIRDIANELLTDNARSFRRSGKAETVTEQRPKKEARQTLLLSSLVDSLVTEKRAQYRSRLKVRIEAFLEADSYGLFADIDPSEFKRVLSNLINNSVEALGKTGHVLVSLHTPSPDEVTIEIEDNGKGISSEVLAKLGQLGETHDKLGGSGLGLYHAKTTLENWGGSLKIDSKVGEGTKVTLTLPRSLPPSWFVDILILKSDSTVVVLDDDSTIHQIWKGRFEALDLDSQGIELLHFSDPEELWIWFQKSGRKLITATYLIDQELAGYDRTGLELIEQMEVGSKSILVTSRYEEPELRKQCDRLGVRLIPKGIAGFVPIEVNKEPTGLSTRLSKKKTEELNA